MGIFDFFRNKQTKLSSSESISKTSRVSSDIVKTDINPTYLHKLANGLYPGEIVLIDWLDGRSVENAPGYFKYEYGIDDKKSSLYLTNEGYLRSSSLIESLPSLKIDQLKEILRSKKLKVSGNKKALIERITENFKSEELIRFIKTHPLHLTEKGNETLNEYYYIVPAHKHNSKDSIYNVATAINYVRKLNYKPTNGDISWALFQEAYNKYMHDFSYGLVSITIRNMAQQLEKEHKYKDALFHYVRVFIISLSGLSNSIYLSHPKHIYPDYSSANKINKLINILDMDQLQFHDAFSFTWSRCRLELPFHYLDEEMCFQCLFAAFDKNNDYIGQVLSEAFSLLNKENFESTYGLKYPFIID